MNDRVAEWVAQSKRRVAVVAQRLRDRAAADVRPDRLGYMPTHDRQERLWSERAVCAYCHRNLPRYASLRKPCASCEATP